jgi:hypothetical protein
LRAADAVIHRDVLHRLHEQVNALNLSSFLSRRMTSEALMWRSSSAFRLIDILPLLSRGVGAIGADEGGEAFDGGILQNDFGELLLFRRHGLEEMVGGAWEMPWMTPVSWTGKNPLGMMM